jgi:hypothetical protein
MNLKLLIGAQPWKGWISGIKPGNSTPIGVGRYRLDYCFFFHRISSGANNLAVFNPIRDWYVAAFFIILGWWNPTLLIAGFKTKTYLFFIVLKYSKVRLIYFSIRWVSGRWTPDWRYFFFIRYLGQCPKTLRCTNLGGLSITKTDKKSRLGLRRIIFTRVVEVNICFKKLLYLSKKSNNKLRSVLIKADFILKSRRDWIPLGYLLRMKSGGWSWNF